MQASHESAGSATPGAAVTVRHLGLCDYESTWRAMQRFTEARRQDTPDEVWLLEHPPVFTLGRAGRLEHVLEPGDIPLVHTDRGGQVTYHGPGQLIAYVLLDLGRRQLGVRPLVEILEGSVVDLLAAEGLAAARRQGAPGVYVGAAKVAALGLRIRRGCSYHGLALNVDVDLAPFGRIDPCGYPGLAVTRLADLGLGWGVPESARRLQAQLARLLRFTPRVVREAPGWR